MENPIASKSVEIHLTPNHDISHKLSMGIGGNVSFFATANSEEDVKYLARLATQKQLPLLVLGGGTNLILSNEGFECLTVFIALVGIKELKRENDSVFLEVAAGENWDEFVKHCIFNGFWGCENLSLIPGTVGATPVQNVGAFGQEVKNIIESVRCYDRTSDSFIEFNKIECGFRSRKSIFNTSFKGRYIICSVVFCLSTVPAPRLSRKEFKGLRATPISNPTLLNEIRNVVVSYRTNGQNLPIGINLGCSGTFFKTGIIEDKWPFIKALIRTTQKIGLRAAGLIVLFSIKYRSSEGFKIPSKLLIQLCGLSRLRIGKVFLLPMNPACVVTDRTESPSSDDLLKIVEIVVGTVFHKTGIVIPIEPEMVGFEQYIKKDSLVLKSIYRKTP